MAFTQSESFSDFKCHHHLTSRLVFNVQIYPTPSPPSVLGATTLSHATQWIFLLLSSPPHRNLRRICSSFSVIATGALKKERKYVGRFPSTEVINFNLPPNESVFYFHEDSLELNLSMIGFQLFMRFMFAPTGTLR